MEKDYATRRINEIKQDLERALKIIQEIEDVYQDDNYFLLTNSANMSIQAAKDAYLLAGKLSETSK